MPLKLLRTIDPGALDADPLDTQPDGDAFGELAAIRGQLPRVIIWEVDTAGRKVSTVTTTAMTVAVVMLSKVQIPGESRSQDMWSRGGLNAGVKAGEEQVQGQARSSVGYTAIVTATDTDPANRLAVYAEVSP